MYLDAPVKPIGEKRMAFHALDWQGFKQIQQILAQRSHARFTYDQGILEITMPLEGHERFARLIELFIRIMVVEMGAKMKSMGSTTLERADLLKSAEPDNGYYLQNYHRVADHEVDLDRDPAPDLVVEVDITHTDINKCALYASLGVSEFWRFDGREWIILCLVNDQYVQRDHSPTFPWVEKVDLYTFLEAALVDEVAAEVDCRQWVRRQIDRGLQ
ncbi:hypothetical protein XM38_029260 [Halomicronema hongdechloris C2206]|uniref:Putative restriction endonuclease domain-containing protein n=1 Tax=Halomicronema hongdechloris C2206 TaxID=1641165 RepID=A0A1Z3HNX5_9CYAN|nr:Uma2 family endonuclease [Halomicronema hongdechloris]ASC71972.1 hypothetical protein XM38_029260 [Halomicronema hongdechloris C2206]